MAYALVDGKRFWYNIAGEGGPPVLLMMGFATRGNAWLEQIEEFKREHQVLWYDHRGIGESESPARVYSMADMADDVAGIMDAAGWSTAHIVGLSMGGMVAQEFAIRYGHRVRSLSLLATTPGGMRGNAACAVGLPRLAQCFVGQGRDRFEGFLKALFPDQFIESKDRQWFKSLLRKDFDGKADMATLIAMGNACRTHDTASRLSRLKGLPALIMTGEQDAIIHWSESRRLHKLIPGSELRSYPEAGHGFNWQVAEEMNRVLARHFVTADARYAPR